MEEALNNQVVQMTWAVDTCYILHQSLLCWQNVCMKRVAMVAAMADTQWIPFTKDGLATDVARCLT